MATRVDLVGIKTSIRSIFEAANTTTASPIDLSANMTKRVQHILGVNPEAIPIQASYYPYVTCYIENKQPDITKTDITKDQLSANRAGEVSITIVGGVWNQNTRTPEEDVADTDINYLMENVELTLRANPTLSGTVRWQWPEDIQYYSGRLDNQTHLRVGVLQLKAKVFY